MFVFGHIGFTLAGFLLLNNSVNKNRNITPVEAVEDPEIISKTPHDDDPPPKFWRFIERTRGLDLRFIVIGSLLPDIIDKPIGRYFFNNVFGDGHLYAHTLAFSLFLALVGYLVFVVKKHWGVFLLAFGCFIHLFLDGLFLKLHVLVWPLLGFAFQKKTPEPFGEWLLGLIKQVYDRPWEALPELIGVIIVVWFFWSLWRQKKLRPFISKGQI
jgi:inner membrane protein